MNATISSQIRPFVVGFAICAANVTLAQIQYPEATASRGDALAFGEASYESALPSAQALLQPGSIRPAANAVAETEQSSTFGTDPRLADSLTALLPLFSTGADRRVVSILGQPEIFDATSLASRTPVNALSYPFGENSEKFRSVTSSLETSGR